MENNLNKHIGSINTSNDSGREKIKRATRKSVAVVTIGAAAFGLFKGMDSLANNESHEAWNNGPELSVVADTDSRVVDHEVVHSSVSTLFDHPSYKIRVEQCYESIEKGTCTSDWVTVSKNQYEEISVGDEITIDKHKDHWSDELQSKRTYTVEHVDE